MTTMEIGGHMFKESGAPSTRSMVESVVLHALVLGLLLLVSASLLLHSVPPQEKRGGHRFLSSIGGSGSRARSPSCRREDSGPTRGTGTRTETETERSERS